jgi:hypothetical protein
MIRRESPKLLAKWLDKDRARKSRNAGRDANRIRRALMECGIQLDKKSNRIPTDLGDILEALRQIQLSVNRLVSTRRKPTARLVHLFLTQIRNDLYIHLDYHYKGLRKPLDLLIDQLESQHFRRSSGRAKNSV